MVIVMAGLPGTGKTTLAHKLAMAIGAVVLSKDAIRAAAFPDRVRDYSTEQNDLAMEMVYLAMTYIHRRFPDPPIIIDGRTFSRQRQVARLLQVTDCLATPVRWIECVCDEEMARQRLAIEHPQAANRDFELHHDLKGIAEPLAAERLTVDTGRLDLEETVRRCLDYLEVRSGSAFHRPSA